MSEQITLVLEYWDINNRFNCTSELKRTEEIAGTQEDIFIEFYNRNRSLRYCNGAYWKFQDKSVGPTYGSFYSRHNTISNYYGSGTID